MVSISGTRRIDVLTELFAELFVASRQRLYVRDRIVKGTTGACEFKNPADTGGKTTDPFADFLIVGLANRRLGRRWLCCRNI